jgi:hypothetical protein
MPSQQQRQFRFWNVCPVMESINDWSFDVVSCVAWCIPDASCVMMVIQTNSRLCTNKKDTFATILNMKRNIWEIPSPLFIVEHAHILLVPRYLQRFRQSVLGPYFAKSPPPIRSSKRHQRPPNLAMLHLNTTWVFSGLSRKWSSCVCVELKFPDTIPKHTQFLTRTKFPPFRKC